MHQSGAFWSRNTVGDCSIDHRNGCAPPPVVILLQSIPSQSEVTSIRRTTEAVCDGCTEVQCISTHHRYALFDGLFHRTGIIAQGFNFDAEFSLENPSARFIVMLDAVIVTQIDVDFPLDDAS